MLALYREWEGRCRLRDPGGGIWTVVDSRVSGRGSAVFLQTPMNFRKKDTECSKVLSKLGSVYRSLRSGRSKLFWWAGWNWVEVDHGRRRWTGKKFRGLRSTKLNFANSLQTAMWFRNKEYQVIWRDGVQLGICQEFLAIRREIKRRLHTFTSNKYPFKPLLLLCP